VQAQGKSKAKTETSADKQDKISPEETAIRELLVIGLAKLDWGNDEKRRAFAKAHSKRFMETLLDPETAKELGREQPITITAEKIRRTISKAVFLDISDEDARALRDQMKKIPPVEKMAGTGIQKRTGGSGGEDRLCSIHCRPFYIGLFRILSVGDPGF